jgi:hypothetical protein
MTMTLVGAPEEEPPEEVPAIVTVAWLGLPMLAPVLALLSATPNVLLPEKGVVPIATANVFGEESPLAHCRVPLVLVKPVPAAAVPLLVEYATLAVPEEPPVLSTVIATLPALWETA